MIQSIQAANATVGAMISLTKNTLVLLIIVVILVVIFGYATGIYKPFSSFESSDYTSDLDT